MNKLLNNWVFFQSVISVSKIVYFNCNMSIKLLQNNDYLISTEDTDGLVL